MGWGERPNISGRTSLKVCVEIQPHPEGGETLVYTDEQGQPTDIGSIASGSAVFSAGEGLAVRRHLNGQLLIENDDGVYRFRQTHRDCT